MKDDCDANKRDCAKEISSLTKNINDLNAGKLTLGSMFKSDDGKKWSLV